MNINRRRKSAYNFLKHCRAIASGKIILIDIDALPKEFDFNKCLEVLKKQPLIIKN